MPLRSLVPVYLQRLLCCADLVQLHGEVDAIVFTGGIGENDADLREAVCANMEHFGISLGTSRSSSIRKSDVSGCEKAIWTFFTSV